MVRVSSPAELASRRLRAVGVLVLVFLFAFVLVQFWVNGSDSKSPLVVGRSIGTIRAPASPAPILPPATAPLSASGDWSVTLPYSSVRGMQFAHNGSYVALLHRTGAGPNVYSVSRYQTSSGTLLQSYALPANVSDVAMNAARDADAVSVTYVDYSSNCSSNPPSHHLLKLSSQQSTPLFSSIIGSFGCASAVAPVVSTEGGIHASSGTPINPSFKRFAPANTSGVPDATLTPSEWSASNSISGDGRIAYTIYGGSPPYAHRAYDFWNTPGPVIFQAPYNAVLSGSAIKANLSGDRIFSCEKASNITRLTLVQANPSPTGTSDSYVREFIDAWPGYKVCSGLEVSDDGKTVYLSFNDGGTFTPSTVNVYHSTDGISYPLAAQWVLPVWLATFTRITSDGSRILLFFDAAGHGSASQVQIYDRGNSQPTFLMDVPGEQVMKADLSPDGTKVALATCAPSSSPCTTSRLRVYDLSLIPTGVRAEYVSNPSNSVRVRWNGVSGALSYSVFRSLSADTASAQIVASGITGTEWVDTQAVSGQTYYYFVKARDTVTHFFSSGVKVLVGNTSPSLSPCPVEGAVLNANGTCTLTIPISVLGYGSIESGSQSSWSDVQNASVGTISSSHLLSEISSSRNSYGGNTFEGARYFFHANLPLISGVQIQTAQLKIMPWYTTEYVPGSASTINVVGSFQANPNVLVGADYSRASLSPSGVYASLPVSAIIPYSPSIFSFTSAGKSALLASSGGPFTFALVEGHHLNGNTFPSGQSYAGNTASFYHPLDDVSYLPFLEIVFTA